MKNPLEQLEARLQALIEGSVARLFPIVNNQDSLAKHLVKAMMENIHRQENGMSWAPNLYILCVHPAQAQILENNRIILDELAEILEKVAMEASLQFPIRPTIAITPDTELSLQEMRILAQFEMDEVGDTSTMENDVGEKNRTALPSAYLIVDGTQTFPLSGSKVNIGRSKKNDLVLEDIRVSRSHAQLRLVNNRYVIFDLDSTGGTFVNHQRVNQIALYPGDVISLAGVPLVYGQDPSYTSGETQEMPSSPPEFP